MDAATVSTILAIRLDGTMRGPDEILAPTDDYSGDDEWEASEKDQQPPVPTLDEDELAVLNSMKRSAFAKSSQAKSRPSTDSWRATGGAGGSQRTEDLIRNLKQKYEYEDDWEEEETAVEGRGSSGSGRLGLGGRELAQLGSAPQESLESPRSPPPDGPARIGSGGTADSGLEDGPKEALDLVFDQDLNCYYSPATGRYYKVASL